MSMSKFLGSSLVFSSALLIKKPFKLPAYCEEKSGAEQQASDLDKIFASHEGGMPPDPEELQEMLMKA